jgi:hypothetical protein
MRAFADPTLDGIATAIDTVAFGPGVGVGVAGGGGGKLEPPPPPPPHATSKEAHKRAVVAKRRRYMHTTFVGPRMNLLRRP